MAVESYSPYTTLPIGWLLAHPRTEDNARTVSQEAADENRQ